MIAVVWWTYFFICLFKTPIWTPYVWTKNSCITKVRERKEKIIWKLCHSWQKSIGINYMFLSEYVLSVSNNTEMCTITSNSHTLTGTIHHQFGDTTVFNIHPSHFLQDSFLSTWVWTPKCYLESKDGKTVFKSSCWICEVILAGRGGEVAHSELSFCNNFEKSQHRQNLAQNNLCFPSQ